MSETLQIPFIDLSVQYERLRRPIDAAIGRVLAHGNYILGPEVKCLEEELCQYTGSRHCITVASGTDALVAGLMAMGVGPGQAVITTPFTFFATVEAVMLLGATPVFADIDPLTFNLCPDQVRLQLERIAKQGELRVVGMIPVDLYGLPAHYDLLCDIAERFGLFVLQDAAQSFGSSSCGKLAPTHGRLGATSFFPAKPLGCFGDGGALFTDDDDLAERLRSIRVHGKGTDKYDNVRVGLNSRLDTLQAAVLLEKLKIYDDEIQRRQQVARWYAERLDPLIESRGPLVGRQLIPENCRSVWAQYVIRCLRRDDLATELSRRGIPSSVYYRTPCHQSKACESLPHLTPMPVAEKAASEVLALPFGPYMEESTVDLICQCIQKWAASVVISRH